MLETFAARKVYDPANTVGEDTNTSLTMTAPQYVILEGMNNTNDFTLQIKLTAAAAWVDFQTIDKSVANGIVVFQSPPNFARVVRSGIGTNDILVYAQEVK